MLFHRFASQEERRAFGGGDFLEMQYCKLEPDAGIDEITSVDAIEHWQDDSLYLCGDDWNRFCAYYDEIITGGTYHNGKSGPVDLCGINYFTQEQQTRIMERLKREMPPDYEVLLDWLEAGESCSGFYILGL